MSQLLQIVKIGDHFSETLRFDFQVVNFREC
jgi:hypothetical protein